MIYKTFYGKHIDLSKLVAVSKAYLIRDGFDEPIVGFDMFFQLMDNPIGYRREFTVVEQGFGWNSFRLIDGRRIDCYPYEELNEKYVLAVVVLQDQVNVLVSAWKKYKTGGERGGNTSAHRF